MYRVNNSLDFIPPPPIAPSNMTICVEEHNVNAPNHPDVWGEAFWLILHLGSLKAPKNVPIMDSQYYWGFIQGLPYMIPCEKCAWHARTFIAAHEDQKDQICSTRSGLVEFFVAFHNAVNRRKGKPEMTVKQVCKMFARGARIKTINYY